MRFSRSCRWVLSEDIFCLHMVDNLCLGLGLCKSFGFCMPLQSCSLLWGLAMLSNCISISTSRVLVLVLVSAHARRKQGRFERWGHLPEGHYYGGYGSKPTGAAKQIPPYGSEGYILVSTNWLLWLTFRRTNMAPYRSVSNGTSTSKTLTLLGLESYRVYNSKVVVWTLSHPGKRSNRKYLLNCYGKGKAWLRESQFLGSDSRCRHVPGMLPPPVCPPCNVTHGWKPRFPSTFPGNLSSYKMRHPTEE